MLLCCKVGKLLFSKCWHLSLKQADGIFPIQEQHPFLWKNEGGLPRKSISDPRAEGLLQGRALPLKSWRKVAVSPRGAEWPSYRWQSDADCTNSDTGNPSCHQQSAGSGAPPPTRDESREAGTLNPCKPPVPTVLHTAPVMSAVPVE